VSVDPSSAALLSPAFIDELDGVGLLLPNAEEAAVLSGEEDPKRAARLLAARIPEVVVTLGAAGALWVSRERVCVADGEGATPVDTTGAGDAFAAGFLIARLSGAGPEEALRQGCRLAAVAVRTPGARPA
jgi:sugar/nucleoside kinase (ribokinase family)